ncbi:MAG TPA: DUF86 domain-containing protein [Gammaproteobacteria bacterium]
MSEPTAAVGIPSSLRWLRVDVCANPHIPWRDIIGQRNILAHEYGQIDHEMIYRTAVRDIPVLAEQLRALLSAVKSGG